VRWPAQTKSPHSELRKTWQLINDALPTNKQKKNKKTINKIVTDGKKIEDFASIAEAFNQHFTTVGKTLSEKITAPSQYFSNFLGNRVLPSMYMELPRLKGELGELQFYLRKITLHQQKFLVVSVLSNSPWFSGGLRFWGVLYKIFGGPFPMWSMQKSSGLFHEKML